MSGIARLVLLLASCVGALLACGRAEQGETGPVGEPAAPAAQPTASPAGETQTGMATVYAGMLEGRETAEGARFSHEQLVAAHRTHPMGTRVRVTNLENGRSVTVRIADRTPAGTEAVVDLSRHAARKLDISEGGQAQVSVEVVD